MSKALVFLSYAPEDESLVAPLRSELEARGVRIAPRRHQIEAGLRWKPALKKSIAESERFLLCFGGGGKGRASWVEDEVAIALEHLRTLPEERAWLIPVKLGESGIPPELVERDPVFGEIDPIDLAAEWKAGVDRICHQLPRSVANPVTAAEKPSGSVMKNTVENIHGPRTTFEAGGGGGSMENVVKAIVSDEETVFRTGRRDS